MAIQFLDRNRLFIVMVSFVDYFLLSAVIICSFSHFIDTNLLIDVKICDPTQWNKNKMEERKNFLIHIGFIESI